MDTADVVVIGAGMAGASAAYHLAAHRRVVVLEQEAVAGYHTTGRSAALFTEAYETGIVRELARLSRPFLENPPPGFSDVSLLHRLPMLTIGRSDQLASLEDAARRGGALVQVLTAVEAEAACPLLLPGYAAGGLLEPGSCSIDVAALHQGYLGGLRRRGGEIRLRAPVTSLEREAGRWRIRHADRVVAAPVVIDAAGAWADRVAVLAGVDPLGLTPYRRTAFTFDPPGGCPAGMPFVADVDEEFYFKPEGRVLMGSLAEESPMEPHDVRPREADVALAIERIEAATTMRIRHVASTWAGLRTFAPDRIIVIGPDPSREGFFWLAGQGGYGILTAPAAAVVAASILLGLPVEMDPAVVSPARLRGDRRDSVTGTPDTGHLFL